MKLIMYSVLAFCLQASNFAFSRQNAPSKLTNTKTVIDSFITHLKIKNVYANQDIWKLIAPAKRDLKTLKEVLKSRCDNQLVTFELSATKLRIETTILGDSVLLGLVMAIVLIDQQGDPVLELETQLPGSKAALRSDANGIFIFREIQKGDSIKLRVAHMQDTTVVFTGEAIKQVEMRPKPAQLTKVVTLELTGYTQIVRKKNTSYTERMDTSIYSMIGGKLVEKIGRTIPGFLEPRILTPGPTSSTGSLRSPGSIRARNSLVFVVENLVIANPDMINPDDIEMITAVRDAPLMGTFGMRAKSGIILIKLKNAKSNQLRVSGIFRMGFSAQPNIWTSPIISSADYISMEERNFKNNIYRERERNQLPLSPIIEGLIDLRDSIISKAQFDALKEKYSKSDIRDDISKLRYQRAFFQQHHVSFSSGYHAFKIYGSVGYSHYTSPEKGNFEDRATIHLSTYYGRNKFSWQSRYFLTDIKNTVSLFDVPSKIPYLPLVDSDNQPLAVPYFRRASYLDTLYGGKYLDWRLKPFQEWQLSDNTIGERFILFNQHLTYKLFNRLQLNVLYQYTAVGNSSRVFYAKESFYVRNEVNQNGERVNGGMYWPIPYGDILQTTNSQTHIHDVRFQVDYKWYYRDITVSSLAGMETQLNKTYLTEDQYFAYLVPGQQWRTAQSLPDSTGFLRGIFQSTNVDISDKGSFSLSFRNDQTNVLGKKNITDGLFYSLGSVLHVDQFHFYPGKFPPLSFRASIGVTGNDNNRLLKNTTIREGFTSSGLPVADIEYSGNSQLKPEKVKMFNAGFKVSSIDTSVLLTFDHYWTESKNLIGAREINSTAGYSQILDNNSGIMGRGFDVYLEIRYGKKSRLKHSTRAWLSHSINKVTSEELPLNEAWKYASLDFYAPRQGYPLNPIFAFPLSKLNGQTGNPVGYLNGKLSENAKAITESSDPFDIDYIGSAIPLYYGSVTHSTQLNGKADISFQFSGRFKYFYRASTYTSSGIIDGTNNHADYSKRWKFPGDENKTNIPSFQQQPDKAKERLFTYSAVNTHRADHIRMEFIQLSYKLDNKELGFMNPGSNLLFCFAVWNLGIIWRKNRLDQDPEAVHRPFPTPRSYSVTVKFNYN